MIPIKNVATPVTAVVSVIVTAVLCSWGARSYLEDMREESSASNAQLAAKVDEKSGALTGQMSDLKHAVDMNSMEVANKLERIDDAIREIDESNVKESEIRIWIERLRAKYPEAPEWGNF